MAQADVGDADSKAETERCTRPAIFWYDIGIIILLAVIAIGYFEFRQQVDNFAAKPVAALALRAMWFAALGGIVISLKGVYDHACKAGGWDDGFSLWHLGRPLSGAGSLEMVTVKKDGPALAGLVPAGPAGAADVTVTNPGGASIVLSGKFKYLQ